MPVLVATGPEPLEVDAALDDLGAPAGRLLLLDGPCESWAEEAARMTLRLDALLAEEPPAGVVVRGGSEAALAAARSALRLGVPVLHLAVEPDTTDTVRHPGRRRRARGVADLAGGRGALPRARSICWCTAARRPRRPNATGSADQTVVRMPSGRGPRSSMTA